MYKNYSLLLPNYPFNSELIAGITQGEKGNYLDFIVDRPEGMKGYMLQLTTFGKGEVFDGKKKFEAVKGQLLLFSPQAMQCYQRHHESQYWHYKWIYFYPDPKWLKWLNWSNTQQHIGKIFINNQHCFLEISQLFSKVEIELKSSHIVKQDLVSTLLEYLLMKCFSIEKLKCIPSIDQRVLIICEYILEHLEQNNSIDELASIVFLSSSRLSHLFKNALGISIVQWKEYQRILVAKKLLHFSNISVASLARSLGYDDSLYFSKLFKKHTGMSPSEFREIERNNG
ncbi:arabinose operon transcriptional regulator AraC [Volucribacter amazonae]|uniref:DNA-binding transcriptional regulator AraC n=1 Tax=Volucribacter amazonae TaxID=256731 RepID=A0A9X4PBC4_9PAST|nr:arabinose operon transcriptional regulator AraC [Volucribacter amazonae]MDG6895953.1 DNA-binding transcriptional regulator AraC [Volucribacter amazonae]